MPEIEPVAYAQPKGTRARRGPLGRAIEWLFRADAMRLARIEPGALDVAQRIRYERARSLAAIADVLAGTGGGGVMASEEVSVASQHRAAISLYREAAFWALSADSKDAPTATLSGAAGAADAFALRCAGEARKAKATRALVERTFVQTAELAEAEQEAELAAARGFVHAVLVELRRRASPVTPVRAQRWGRIAAIAGAVALGTWVTFYGRQWVGDARHPDLAAAAHWRVSSHFEGYGGDGVGFQTRGAGGNVFFHTVEEPAPWIDFDLGQSTTIYRVVVNNRTDCCGERTVPLILEVSDDDATWTAIAERADTFVSWEARFRARAARYVRLRIPRSSFLHLERVEIH